MDMEEKLIVFEFFWIFFWFFSGDNDDVGEDEVRFGIRVEVGGRRTSWGGRIEFKGNENLFWVKCLFV